MRYFIAITATLLFTLSCTRVEERKFVYLDGFTQGTSYLIAYNCADSIDYQNEIKEIFSVIDNSMSIYNEKSIITRINHNSLDVKPDRHFVEVFERASYISQNTGGAFDITVGPLVNAWGFGFTEKVEITRSLIDSLLLFTGYDGVRLEQGVVIKDNPLVMLDMNAIAKGYTVDLVAQFLDSMGVPDYMVEVGGEVRVKGTNRNNQLWRIGVDKPVNDPAAISRELQEILHLTDVSVATSGNYRKFYMENGQRFAHTIDPATGYPVRHNLLSATVVTKKCMDADAYATAFMVMGLEKSLEFLENYTGIDAYFIYDDSGEYAVAYTPGMNRWFNR